MLGISVFNNILPAQDSQYLSIQMYMHMYYAVYSVCKKHMF